MNTIKKYSKLAIIIGAALITLSIICFVVLGISIGRIDEFMGYRPSASELKEALQEAKELSKMLGGSITDFIGISAFEMFLVNFSLTGRVLFLILGLILVGAGLVLKFIKTDSASAERAKAGLSHGIATASSFVKDTIDKATVKCPKCGKVCGGKTVFCPACGEKLEKAAAPVPSGKTYGKAGIKCEKCGKVYHEKTVFCSACGTKLPEIKEVSEPVCAACGKKNAAGARFCSSCGAGLTEAVSEPVKKKPGIVYDDDLFAVKEESAVVCAEKPVIIKKETPKPAAFVGSGFYEKDTLEPVVSKEIKKTGEAVISKKPTVVSVEEKKNPFMSKAKGL